MKLNFQEQRTIPQIRQNFDLNDIISAKNLVCS